ncbi:hypothetical protein NQ315_003188 [Exocentrus adspersus]|uniref:Tyr recombinase domain-containing protein n=1 Tax=Exocentrus adspersus TaxID=1586481 RepID=A0AAV8VN74_9CUCU|nr:hypothetical protein NQ315_003188 [Exocentrus adspersus]
MGRKSNRRRVCTSRDDASSEEEDEMKNAKRQLKRARKHLAVVRERDALNALEGRGERDMVLYYYHYLPPFHIERGGSESSRSSKRTSRSRGPPEHFKRLALEVLKILGRQGPAAEVLGEDIHEEVAQVWAALRRKGNSYNRKMLIPIYVKEELDWWKSHVSSFNSLLPHKFILEIFSDASRTGWGVGLRKQGCPEDAIKVLLSSLTETSLKKYNVGLKRWWEFCFSNKLDCYNPCCFEKGVSYGSLNTFRSALSLVLSPTVGNDHLIKRFLKGTYRLRPTRPKYSVTWDPTIVLRFFTNLDPNELLCLELLTRKFVTLMALTTAHRVQTFSLIQVQNIPIKEEGIETKIPDMIKTSGPSRIQPLLRLPRFDERPQVCVASVLTCYLKKTQTLRSSTTDKLLITYKKLYKAASSQSISSWIKATLKDCGLDTSIFSAHSTRHAATSAAARKGIPLDVYEEYCWVVGNFQCFCSFL